MFHQTIGLVNENYSFMNFKKLIFIDLSVTHIFCILGLYELRKYFVTRFCYYFVIYYSKKISIVKEGVQKDKSYI